MTYAQGGVISATDYNGLARTNTANVAWVWGTGFGANGYGQSTTGISTLSAGTTVTATQWTGLFNIINRCLGHQGQTQLMGGGNLNAVAGSIITYFANVASSVTTINNNAAGFGSQGATTTGTNFLTWANAALGTSYGPIYSLTRTVTFSSGDAARYFFNTGGQINFVISSVTAGDASARTSDTVTLIGTNMGGLSALRNTQTGGRTGSGGTLNTNNTTQGYRNLSTAQITFVQVTSTGVAYTSDVANLRIRTNGTQGTAGDTGSIIYFDLGLNLPEADSFNNTLSVGINHRIDIVVPETTYLTSVWGSPTVT